MTPPMPVTARHTLLGGITPTVKSLQYPGHLPVRAWQTYPPYSGVQLAYGFDTQTGADVSDPYTQKQREHVLGAGVHLHDGEFWWS
jgi:hypothetical protein